MRMIPCMDFETYSSAGYEFDPRTMKWVKLVPNKPAIAAVGAAVYAEHPSARVLSLAYNLLDGHGVTLYTPSSPPPERLFNYINSGGMIEAHNSAFEYFIWEYICHRRMGWPRLPLSQLRCSASKARAWGLPGALGKIGDIILTEPEYKKDKAGYNLIQQLCIPKQLSKAEPFLMRTPETHPDLFQALYRYNEQDVVSEQYISSLIPELSEDEMQIWLMDQRMNARGVYIDPVGLEALKAVYNNTEAELTLRLQEITDGAVETSAKLEDLKRWLDGQGIHTNSLDKSVIKDLLSKDIPDVCREALQIRKDLSSSPAKKIFTIDRMRNQDGRVRGLFIYCGAERTGRWSGSGVQPQNLPSKGPDLYRCPACGGISAATSPCPRCHCFEQESAGEWGIEGIEAFTADAMATQDPRILRRAWPDVIKTLSASIRGLFCAAPGKRYISSDYSAIEAVGMAMLSGEEWRIEVFRTHGKIYEMSASKITGVPFEEIMAHKITTGQHHPLRKTIGKVAELALGYGGWIGAMVAFGADKFLTEEEMKSAILKWREASPMIEEFWGGQLRKVPGKWQFYPEYFGLEGCAVQAILNPGTWYTYRSIGYIVHDDKLYCRLPSGRHLTYWNPRLIQAQDRRSKDHNIYQIWFNGYNTDASQGQVGWIGIQTHGGKLAENCVAEGTEVLTDRGWIKIEDYTPGYRLWDGCNFVYGGKLLDKGIKPVLAIHGAYITADHLVLCENNTWRSVIEITSENSGPNIQEIYVPNDNRVFTFGRGKDVLERGMRLRENLSRKGVGHDKKAWAKPKVVWVYDKRTHRKTPKNTRYDKSPGLLGVAFNGRPLSIGDPSILEKLRSSWDTCVRSLGRIFSKFLGGYGGVLRSWANVGQAGQFRGLLQSKLSLGKLSGPVEQQKIKYENKYPMGAYNGITSRKTFRRKRYHDTLQNRRGMAGVPTISEAGLQKSVVFDITDVGPLNRFTIRGADKIPFIVHNCTQAACRDLIAYASVNLDAAGYHPVLTIHDELVCEVDEGLGSVEEFERIMSTTPPWAADWPVRASGGWEGRRFRK